MLIHSVYFWLKPDLTAADRDAFVAGLTSLCTLKDVYRAEIGTPAPYDRPVIERGYDWALLLAFRTNADHDAYQIDPVHDVFRSECAQYWSTVKIFDVTTTDVAV
jgi:hypothetical protein